MLVADPEAPQLDADGVHHLGRVLRLDPGEVVVATDGRGRWTRCRYRGDGSIEVDGPVEIEARPSPALTVAFTPVKGERPEWVVQKLTELGIDRIVVLTTARSVVRWDHDRTRAALDRFRRVAAEAAAQSRRVWLPEVDGVVGLDGLERDGMALAEPGGRPLGGHVTGIAVGPEGGWAPEELAPGRAEQQPERPDRPDRPELAVPVWPTVGLATHVLRAETAAIAAGVLLGAQRAGTVARHGK